MKILIQLCLPKFCYALKSMLQAVGLLGSVTVEKNVYRINNWYNIINWHNQASGYTYLICYIQTILY